MRIRALHRPLAGAFALHLVAAIALACASPVRIEHASDPAANFPAYATWAWIVEDSLLGPTPGSVARYVSPIDENHIRRAVEVGLARRGYRQLHDVSQADLIVSFSVGTEQKTRVYSSPGAYYPNYYGYGYGGWYESSRVSVHQYTEGTLAVEFYDRHTRRAVWVGVATKRLSESDDSEAVIREAVNGILRHFPARPGFDTAPEAG